ncbi:hypothetical protein VTO42DRAFT_487 [Malbranchea cinnamomea]
MAPIPETSEASRFAMQSYGFGGRALSLVVVSFVMLFMAALLVTNRLVCRMVLKKPLGIDDYVIAVSLTICSAMVAVILVGVHYGYGRRSSTLPLENVHMSMKMFWVLQILYKCTINTTKLSILLLYRTIFETNRFKFRTVCNVLFVIILLHTFTTTVATILECVPISKVWERSIPGTCINLTAFWYTNAVFNISIDFLIFLLPMPVINTLSLPLRSKFALMGIFALGAFVCATSVVRMTTLKVSSTATDQIHGTMVSTIWTVVESCAAIICSCLPMLRVPLTRLFPDYFSINWCNMDTGYLRSFPLISIPVRDPGWKGAPGETEGDRPRSSCWPTCSTIRRKPTQHGLARLHLQEGLDESRYQNEHRQQYERNATCSRKPTSPKASDAYQYGRSNSVLSTPQFPDTLSWHQPSQFDEKDSSHQPKNSALILPSRPPRAALPLPHCPVTGISSQLENGTSVHSITAPASSPPIHYLLPSYALEKRSLQAYNWTTSDGMKGVLPVRTRRLSTMPPRTPPPSTPPPASPPPALKDSPTIPEAVALSESCEHNNTPPIPPKSDIRCYFSGS